MPIIQGKKCAVSAGLVVRPSDSTPENILDKLSFWRNVPKNILAQENGRIYSSDYFSGNDWLDHINVLIEVLHDDIEVLKRLVFLDTTVTLYIWWTGKPGVSPPTIGAEDLGPLCFPGIKFELNADWDFGNRAGDLVLASFCVYGPDPSLVTDFFGEPSRMVRAGDPISLKRKNTNVFKHNAWILNTEDFCTSSDIFKHIEKLYDHLGPPTFKWREFVKSTGADVSLGITWHAASGQVGPAFSYEQLKKLGLYSASLHEETYDYEPDTG